MWLGVALAFHPGLGAARILPGRVCRLRAWRSPWQMMRSPRSSLSLRGFRAGYGAMLTFCERGRHGCRCFPRSCSPGAGLTRRIVRVAVTCAFTAMVGSGRRPGTGGLLRGAGRDPVAVWWGCPVWAGAVSRRLSCLTLPLPVRPCPAPCSLGCEGSWVGSDGLPRASPELPAWPGASGSLGGRRLLWTAVSPHRPPWSIRIFSN
jgi:hypothetical protein